MSKHARVILAVALGTFTLGAVGWTQAPRSKRGARMVPAVRSMVVPTASQAGRMGPAVRPLAESPPPAWRQGDPADSLYRAAREALNSGNYARAAELFAQVEAKYPRSTYAPDALYWRAFSMYRNGGGAELRAALEVLRHQRQRYPQAGTRGDAETLETRIRGELARRGDPAQADSIVRTAGAVARSGQPCPSDDDENDMRVAALNALLQMDADRAVPILRQVLARRDECSAALRRKAVFLLSQKRTPETADILMSVLREDPDPEVRGQAVFWLGQVPGDEAVDALLQVLRTSKDSEVKEKALFALSQHRGERSAAALRDFASNEAASGELREKAIFWIGQSRSQQNAEFLRALFARTTDEELKERILFSLSQMGREMNGKWLLDVATGSQQPVEIRKKALFWAAQGGAPAADLVALYDRMGDQEMKEQLVFAYSQRQEKAFVDKLIDIARNEKDTELRKKAIFWLSQSRDPRVVQVLQEIINR